MTYNLSERVAIITGAASGIGRTTSIMFADEGAKVVVVDLMAEEGKETVNQIKERDGEAFFIKANIADEAQVSNMVEKTMKVYGGVDVLFNNAGISSKPLRIEISDLTEYEWNRVLDVNLKGVFFCTRNVFPEMKKRKGGSIINVSSIAALNVSPELTPYTISKAGVITLTNLFAVKGAPFNIRVNCVLPGVTDTPMLRQAWTERYGVYEPTTAGPIASRVARPEEIAKVVLFLASDDSSYVSGASIPVTGASHLASRSRSRQSIPSNEKQ